jgi:predicted ATPase
MIRRLHVRNFKSMRDLTLDLGGRTILVGPNMAGKSNILSVFRFLGWMVQPSSGAGGLEGAVTAAGGVPQLAWRGGESTVISIRLEGDFAGIQQDPTQHLWEYSIEIRGNPRGLAVVQDERLVFEGPSGRVMLIERDPATGDRVLRDLTGAQVARVQDAWRSGLEYEIPGWIGAALRGYFLSWHFYALTPDRMRLFNPTAAVGALQENGDNLSAWLMTLHSKYGEAFERLQRAASDVLPHLVGLYPFPTAQGQVFLASRERGLKSDVPVWQMSNGELCFIALLSLLFAPRELAAPLYCVEEPENHLHPRLLETLMDLLRQRQEELGPGQAAQILATTHSPTLVDQADVSELVIVDRRDGQTVCRRPEDKAQLRELLNEAGLGELYFSGALGSA